MEIDIFELSPENYQIIFDTLQTGINIVHPSGTIIYVNNAYCRMHGYQKEEMIGESLEMILPDEDVKKGLENFRKIVKGQRKTSHVIRSFNRRKDGSLFPVVIAWNFLLKRNKLVGMVSAVQDITEMAETKAELKKTQHEMQELQNQLEQRKYLEFMMGDSLPIKQIQRAVENVAATDFSVLITGETGSGKELVAESIHNFSSRNKFPLISVDCGAIPNTLIESELFGHQKGAFTGADRLKEGAFQKAHHGTIFLDEITNLSVNMQKKLLRVLEKKEVQKIGSTRKEKLDIRILAATNEHIEKLVERSEFRKDLFFRLNEFMIRVPALRNRRDDIPLLVQRFIKEICHKLKIKRKSISKETLTFLNSYNWPGNVRQLRNALKRAIVVSDKEIRPEHFELLGSDSRHITEPDIDFDLEQSVDLKNLSRQVADNFESQIIRKTLEKFDGNKSKTARFLNIDYKTLLTKIKNYGINSIE
ncbi:MAG: sigma 54-interacting transcriptional regulator [Candidatus Cloacimonetes bacterium]|nr:sigma 54-interacting transcriptional regulator [Candidatus Cloacimonadota bacterium]